MVSTKGALACLLPILKHQWPATQATIGLRDLRSASSVQMTLIWMMRTHVTLLGAMVCALGSSDGTVALVPLQVGLVLLLQIILALGHSPQLQDLELLKELLLMVFPL